MDLSIVIVNHNTSDLTKNAIISIFKTVFYLKYEIIVVDNSENNSSIFCVFDERVKIIQHVQNKGFGHACNLGFSYAVGKYVLFLNSDTILFKDAINSALKFMSIHKKIGALGIRQLLPDGSLDFGCKRGFPTPLNSFFYFSGISKMFPMSKKLASYQQTFIDENSIASVDCISGAFMLIKREIFHFVGGFDEEYFMYGEDVDICYRLQKLNLINVYYGLVSFLHMKSQGYRKNIVVLDHFYRSMKIFYDKHYKKRYSFLTEFLVKFGIDAKCFFSKRFYNVTKK